MTASTTTLTAAEARRAARNATALTLANIASNGVMFLWQLVLAIWLGVSDYGVYGTVTALFAVAAAVPNFGMGTIVIRDVARFPERAGKYLTATLFMQTILALLAYLAVNAGALEYTDTIRAFTAVAAISLIIDIIGSMCYDLLLAKERMVVTSLVDVGHIFVRIGLAGLALVLGWGLMGVYIATIISGLGRTLLLWVLLARSGVRPEFPLDWSIARPLFLNSLPLALTAFLGLAYQNIDKLMTTKILGTVGTGYLNAAFVIIYGVVDLLNTTILVATFPMMSRYHGDGKNPMFAFIIEKLLLFTLLANLPICLLLGVFAPQITIPLFGVKYAPTADVLRLLIWYALVTMAAAIFSRGFVIQNRQRYLLVIRIIGLVINIALIILLLPALGVRGAPIASVIAESSVVIALALNFRPIGWQWGRLTGRLIRLAALAITTALVMLALGQVHPIAGMVGGLVFYSAGVLFGHILSTDDWDLLYRLTAAMPGGAFVLKYWRRNVTLNW